MSLSSSTHVATPPAVPSSAETPPTQTPPVAPRVPQKPWLPGAALELRGVGKRFDSSWVVRGLSFAVQPGTIFGVFGPSGSGKTTTLRLLLGLLDASEGEMRVLGTPLREFTPRTRARIGYLPQLFVLYPELTVSQNMHLVASLYGLGWLKRGRPMRRVLEFVELWEHRNKLARALSGGMQRRLELAAALIHDPELLVVDEPTAGIDPILRAKLWEHFRELRDQRRTILVTSQYVTEAEYCDCVVVLAHGEIAATGSPDELRRQAMGGEIIDLTTSGVEAAVLEKLSKAEGVKAVRRLSYEELQLTVARASEAMPRILAVLAEERVSASQIQEYRPNFDEVFVRLLGQERAHELHAAGTV